MHPIVFIRSLEDQLRKVKAQYGDVKKEPRYFELSPDELIKNSSLWFLSVIQNTSLESEGIPFSAQDFLVDESLSRSKIPPYELLYPSLVWFMTHLGKERLEYLFGASFIDRLNDVVREFRIDGGDYYVQ